MCPTSEKLVIYASKPKVHVPAFNIASAAPLQKTRTDEFLNADNDTTDYDWKFVSSSHFQVCGFLSCLIVSFSCLC